MRNLLFKYRLRVLNLSRYLLQHHSDHFVDAWSAKSKIASLCTSFLTFSCFDPYLDQDQIERSVLRGDYAFQEYSVLNWIHHARAFRSHSSMLIDTDTDTSRLDCSIISLFHNYLKQFPSLRSVSSIPLAAKDDAAVLRVLDVCQKANIAVEEVRKIEDNAGKTENKLLLPL